MSNQTIKSVDGQTFADIDDAIFYWHMSDTAYSNVWEFLGWTEDEYMRFLDRGRD